MGPYIGPRKVLPNDRMYLEIPDIVDLPYHQASVAYERLEVQDLM